jgi:predicted GNAT family acetyltransferase
LSIRRLEASDVQPTLEFLNREPIKNVLLIGMIRDNGLQSPRNRGIFYGDFTRRQLEGVVLIGHHVCLSARLKEVAGFARIARRDHPSQICMVIGEEAAAGEFSSILTKKPSNLRLLSVETQLLFTMTEVRGASAISDGLRLATVEETDEVADLNARAYEEMLGVDPRLGDAAGFRRRLLEKVERGRIWVLKDKSGIVFKADLVIQTEDVAYLEGIITRPDVRGRGLGSVVLRDLCQRLLLDHKRICLFADFQKQRLVCFYQRIGFEPVASYRLVRYCQPGDIKSLL